MPSDLEDFADSLLIEGRVYNEHDQELFQERTGTASQSDLNSIESRTTTIETNLNTVTNDLGTVTADLDSLEETVNGIQVGDSYRVPNLADLPSTPNSTPATIYGSVYADSVSSDNNGRYYKEPGSSTWVKVPGDLTGRVVDLEEKTFAFYKVKEPLYYNGKLLKYVGMMADGGIFLAVDEDLTFISKHSHPNATIVDSGFMSNLDKSILDNLPVKRLKEQYHNGNALRYALEMEDDGLLLYNYKSDGVIRITQAQFGKIVGALVADSVKVGETGFEFKIRTDLPGWFWVMTWEDDGILWGVKRLLDGTGETVIPGLNIPGALPGSITSEMLADDSVTYPKLGSDVTRIVANDYLEGFPDDVRSFEQDAVLGFYTKQNWEPLPRQITPVVEGINDSTTSLSFRLTAGLLVAGQRRVGTYDPSVAGPSLVEKGTISESSTWPPSGTFIDGDYYHYVSDSARVIGSDTLNRGDEMVYVSGSWLYKAGPGSGTTIYRKDFWEITAAGIFEGISLVAGDRLIYVTYQSSSGSGRRRWRKGLPGKKECFRCSLLPISPLERDLWEAPSAGVYAGFTLAEGDYLLRTGSVWTHIQNSPVKVVPNGAGYHLRCAYTSAEWEVKRTDGSLSSRPVIASIRTASAQRIASSSWASYTDSMGAQVAPVIAADLGRPVSNNAYGGGTSDDVEGMAEWHISNGDANKGRGLITIIGQNSGTHLGQTMACRIQLERLMNVSNRRFVHASMLGTRVMTWDGTRLRCPNIEEQWVDGSTNIYAVDIRNLKATRPNNYFWAAENIGKAAIGDNGPSIQWPGKTNEEVWNEYHIYPLKYCRSITPSNGLDYCINFIDKWNVAGLPTGGSSGDFYLRVDGGTIGRPIANILGTWTEITYDVTHLSVAGDAIQGHGLAAKIIEIESR